MVRSALRGWLVTRIQGSGHPPAAYQENDPEAAAGGGPAVRHREAPRAQALPPVPSRQWGLSFPHGLRWRMAHHHKLGEGQVSVRRAGSRRTIDGGCASPEARPVRM